MQCGPQFPLHQPQFVEEQQAKNTNTTLENKSAEIKKTEEVSKAVFDQSRYETGYENEIDKSYLDHADEIAIDYLDSKY